MTASIRITLRRFQELDLRIEKIPERFCRLAINPDPRSDDCIVVDFRTVDEGSEPGNAEGEVDHPIYRTATGEQVCEGNLNIVGIGNQFNALGHYNLHNDQFDNDALREELKRQSVRLSQQNSSVYEASPALKADDKGRSAEERADRPTEQGGGDD